MLNNDEIRDIVELEGLGYAVEEYMSWESVENPMLRIYWKAAKDALTAIRKILDETS